MLGLRKQYLGRLSSWGIDSIIADNQLFKIINAVNIGVSAVLRYQLRGCEIDNA